MWNIWPAASWHRRYSTPPRQSRGPAVVPWLGVSDGGARGLGRANRDVEGDEHYRLISIRLSDFVTERQPRRRNAERLCQALDHSEARLMSVLLSIGNRLMRAACLTSQL